MDNVKLLKSLYDAFGRGEIPTVLGAMSPEIRWYQAESNPYNPSGEAWVGPDAVLNNLFVRLGTEWEGFAVHTKAFYDAGDSVIVEARYSGTYKPNGKSIDARGAASVACIYQFGTTTTGTSGTVTLKLQESTDDSAFTDITGATTTALTTDAGAQNAKRVCLSAAMQGRSRYIRCVLTVAGTVATGATGPLNNGGVMLAGALPSSLLAASFDTFIAVVV